MARANAPPGQNRDAGRHHRRDACGPLPAAANTGGGIAEAVATSPCFRAGPAQSRRWVAQRRDVRLLGLPITKLSSPSKPRLTLPGESWPRQRLAYRHPGRRGFGHVAAAAEAGAGMLAAASAMLLRRPKRA